MISVTTVSKQFIIGATLLFTSVTLAGSDYTLLDLGKYQQTVKESRLEIEQILEVLRDAQQDNNLRIELIAQALSDRPFLSSGTIGEGDWQPDSLTYQPGAAHIKQDPLYRLDGFDCQTIVQVVMGLALSNNLNEFDQNYLSITYGAAGSPLWDRVHYYNRNHFIDGDWNPINQRNGWLNDVTGNGALSAYAKTISATLTRQNWFRLRHKEIQKTVRVLRDEDGSAMADRFRSQYYNLNFPRFDTELVSIHYLPKESIAIPQSSGGYKPNQALLDLIPTPAVIEIVRDPKLWTIDGKNIKEINGSELSISHMGVLFRKHFENGEVIYQKISCRYDSKNKKQCSVKPVLCDKKYCDELMMVHATKAYPDGYYWYKSASGEYHCRSILPTKNTPFTQCNRVLQMPLYQYLTEYQYGKYPYMESPSILGVHIERFSW
jgi:hypothetical protein